MGVAKEKYSQLIKKEAARLGFSACGIAKATYLENEAPRLEKWLKENRHGKMSYMENHFDKRLDPSKLVPGAKSVVMLQYNYYPESKQRSDTYKIAKYAYGEDYHFVIKEKLYALLNHIEEKTGKVSARVFTDSAPVLERVWAQRSGLGWIGKNSLLLSKNRGSFYFLAEIILDLELEYDNPLQTDHCGTCTRCIDACPTGAILQNKTIDGSKCISYLTIELRDEIPSEFKEKFDDWMFGCDICQDVCPWNRFSLPHTEPRFNPHPDLLAMSKKDWEAINEETFKRLFKKSAVKRTKFKGLLRNISFIKPDKI